MSLELLNSIGTIGTFLVISATAIAAVAQLRHARSANLIEAFTEVQRTFAAPEFIAAQHFVLTELPQRGQDPAFRHQVTTRSARTPEGQTMISKLMLFGNTYENLGVMVRMRLVDPVMALEMFYGNAIAGWDALAPMTAALRRNGNDATWENFEYFAVLSQDWEAAHPHGTYPAGIRRIAITDVFQSADDDYAASLPPT